MDVIEIRATSHDLHELCKTHPPFRHPILVGCQISCDHVWSSVHGRPGWSPDGTEVLAPAQVDRRIDGHRHGKRGSKKEIRRGKVWVSARGVIEVWRPATGVATIAIAYRVDQI